ncbi:aromatic ring-hydroxylating dioxygenase subunit alpha [Mycobacterium sp. 050128]|uniref:aromatic ring-hydroxylating oxygenase subunit alpha n=1 Tax=Mycobacterium sp. 050128 TaxID=3096112 RepID=UPI002ED867B8
MAKLDDRAPVPSADLAAALAPFGRSRMLPREAYVDPEVFEWEQRHIFSGWTCVGHASDIAEVGAQLAVGSGVNGVLLVRSEESDVRAFANVCRHRGHELLPCGESTKKRSIICPYHSWSFRLDGALRNAPGFRDAADFNPDEFGLTELRLVDWHGWLFVDPSGHDTDFSGNVAGLEDVIGPYRPEELIIVARHSYELAANWKVIVENYQECYHCPTIHPELSRVSPPTSGATLGLEGTWLAGWMSIGEGLETMSLTGKSGGGAIAGLSEQQLCTVMYVVGYPNLLVSLHPDYIMTHLMTPLAIDRTHVECAWAFPKDVASQDNFDPSYAVDFWDLTNRQDWGACESVQRGLTSPLARPGPLAPDEEAVYQFVTRVAQAYACTT